MWDKIPGLLLALLVIALLIGVPLLNGSIILWVIGWFVSLPALALWQVWVIGLLGSLFMGGGVNSQ